VHPQSSAGGSALQAYLHLLLQLIHVGEAAFEQALHILHALALLGELADALRPSVDLRLVRADLAFDVGQVFYYAAGLLTNLGQVRYDVSLVGLMEVLDARLHLIEAQKRHPFDLPG